MRTGLRLLLLTALLAFGGCAGFVRQNLYKPRTDIVAITDWTKSPPAEVRATTADGIALQGFQWAGKPGSHDVILFFHGRRAHQGVGAKYAQYLVGKGPAVLVASYRGFAGNPGSPSREGLLRDGAAFIALARQLHGADARIFLVGHSLGGAVALELATRAPVAGVVLIEPFAALGEVAPDYARPFLVDRWDNREAIAAVAPPVVIFHGTADDVVPLPQAQSLLAAACNRALLVTMPGATHKPNMPVLGPAIADTIRLIAEDRLAALPATLPEGWRLTDHPPARTPACLTRHRGR
ncbi:alpha/beta hydrolase [Edaphosphingomonas haloaromaticamans]|uniref:Alpha/beta hydrolase family protein n=1 Tax=Edaphosphingomonas haloaromaticamans TaxID=653954 RepID=A0A1S1H8G6_9SPHN|nr:alpha/beta fold hydrolase [Sphingomonas haloaromaticamans]OHT18489.1 Alpha/beta hydrolase family protein [Sphingomonas haloaromaticamans]